MTPLCDGLTLAVAVDWGLVLPKKKKKSSIELHRSDPKLPSNGCPDRPLPSTCSGAGCPPSTAIGGSPIAVDCPPIAVGEGQQPHRHPRQKREWQRTTKYTAFHGKRNGCTARALFSEFVLPQPKADGVRRAECGGWSESDGGPKGTRHGCPSVPAPTPLVPPPPPPSRAPSATNVLQNNLRGNSDESTARTRTGLPMHAILLSGGVRCRTCEQVLALIWHIGDCAEFDNNQPEISLDTGCSTPRYPPPRGPTTWLVLPWGKIHKAVH